MTGGVPAGKYKGLVFTVGVPSLAKDAQGNDVALNHSNLATAPAPLDVQGMNWGWQAGRKFIA
ncbi:MbnP family protein [Methylosinus sp. R-45379]|uniref:MbnP family protein n=1 Tax=Methylosinus sp. R-45379 TaxID=980563 RepID=UPI00352DEF42